MRTGQGVAEHASARTPRCVSERAQAATPAWTVRAAPDDGHGRPGVDHGDRAGTHRVPAGLLVRAPDHRPVPVRLGRRVHHVPGIQRGTAEQQDDLGRELGRLAADRPRRRHGPQTVLWLSHDLRLSELVFGFLARILEHRIAYRTFSFGRQRLILDNGSSSPSPVNTPSARARMVGRSGGCGRVVADQAGVHQPRDRPGDACPPQPQLIMMSTAGDENSELLKQWRERGLSIIESGEPSALAMLEWSMPPSADWHDPKWWSWPNPCLGTTLTRRPLLAESQGPGPRCFPAVARSTCGPPVREGWLPAGQWDACRARRCPNPGRRDRRRGVDGRRALRAPLRAWNHNGVATSPRSSSPSMRTRSGTASKARTARSTRSRSRRPWSATCRRRWRARRPRSA